MKYSQVIFNQDLYTLAYADIVQFFDTEKEENLNLEFKSYPAQGSVQEKENSVMKAICGLLNSEGGIVIWGAPTEGKNAQGNTTAQGALTPFDTNLDRDRLINKISSLIIPLPIGIRVQQLNDANGASIFVIEVEKSSQKPHQFKNNYYIRLDGQTKVAPHYLIEAMMKSIDFPVIRGHIRLKRIELEANNVILYLRKLIYNTSKYTNDLNLSFKLVATPGTMIINGNVYVGFFDGSEEILSHGRPVFGEFRLVIPSTELMACGNIVNVVLSFVGEKSPSKVSIYKYSLANLVLGIVGDENNFLEEKQENQLSSDTNGDSDDDKINSILDYD